MKFITEDDLRDLYRKQPFMDYDLQPGERLTPGARQFLLDRGINLYDDDPFLKPTFKKTVETDSKCNYEEKAVVDKQKQKRILAGIKSQLEGIDAILPDILEEKMAQDVSADLNQVINTLSQMICDTVGGKNEG